MTDVKFFIFCLLWTAVKRENETCTPIQQKFIRQQQSGLAGGNTSFLRGFSWSNFCLNFKIKFKAKITVFKVIDIN